MNFFYNEPELNKSETRLRSWKRCGALTCAVALAALLAGCANMGNSQGHPLIGKVWDASARRFVAPSSLVEHAASARFILLGEIHDNAQHHRIQARILQDLVQYGRRPALVMEQFDLDRADRMGEVLHSTRDVEHKLRSLQELMRESWGWSHYQPLVRLALEHSLPLAPANLGRDSLRKLARPDSTALGESESTRLALDIAWTAQRQAQLTNDVRDGHCGKLSEHILQTIVKAQRIRDAVMADRILSFAEPGAVVILGISHARADMGVPLYLRARTAEASVLSIGIMQVNDWTDPTRYAEGALGRRFDYVWFTAPAKRTFDACDSIPSPGVSTSR